MQIVEQQERNKIMPQDPNKIKKAILDIMAHNPHLVVIHTTEESKEISKLEFLRLIEDKITMLSKTKQISPDEFTNASTAIKFYKEHSHVPFYQNSPQNLIKELTDIDYKAPIKIRTVKPGVILSQMQQEWHSAKVGNFYTVGSLPTSFEERASQSGIGFKSKCATPESHLTHHEHEHHAHGSHTHEGSQKKAVYMSQTTDRTVFLESRAYSTDDSWSVPGLSQNAKGGGVQYRISDVKKSIERLSWGVFHDTDAPQATKSLRKGIGAPKPSKGR